MHEACVHLAARHRQVADRQRVGLERRQRLAFGHVHVIVGGRVQDHLRLQIRERAFHSPSVADIHGRPVQASHHAAARFKLAHQLDAKLPAAPEDNNFRF